MKIDERLRKFLLMRGSPVGVDFSEKEVREYTRVFLRETRSDEAWMMLIEDLIFMINEHLAEKEG